MLTKPQIILLKRAQRQAAIGDDEYRELLRTHCNVLTSKDPSLTDAHLDRLLSFFEAVFWRQVDAGTLPAPGSRDVFFQRGYWSGKNSAASNSRDRHVMDGLVSEIGNLENSMLQRGKTPEYCAAILQRVCGGAPTTVAQCRAYITALRRTLDARPGPLGNVFSRTAPRGVNYYKRRCP